MIQNKYDFFYIKKKRPGGNEIVIAEAVAKGLKYPKIKFEKEESYEKTQVDPNLFLVFTLYGCC